MKLVRTFLATILTIFATSASAQQLQHFTNFQNSDISMSLLIRSALMDGSPLSNGDEIGVYTPGGVLAGASVVQGAQIGIAAWGDDPNDQAVTGFRANEVITYKYWDHAADREWVATPSYAVGNGRWAGNGLAALTLSVTRPHPRMHVSDAGHDFGAVRAGNNATWSFSISNDGDVDLVVQSITLSDQSYSTDVSNFSVARGHNQAVRVTFAPTAAGNLPCTLSINSNDTGGVVRLNLTGIGLQYSHLVLSSNSHDFGSIPLGTSSSWSLTVSNTGDGVLAVSEITSENQAYSTDLSQFSVPAGGSQIVQVTFTPVAAGDFPCRLSIASNDTAGVAAVSLLGSAYRFARLRLSDQAHDFGNIALGSSAAWDFTIFNDGNGDLTVQSITLSDQAYSTDVANFSVAPGQSRAVRVSFTPTTAGDIPCTLTINSNDAGGAARISLTGSAYQFARLRLSDQAHDFGSIALGSSTLWDFTVFNDGNGDLTVQSIALSDQDYSTDIANFTVAPGQSRAVRVAFTPTAAGDFPCQLVINSNDVGGAARINMTGSAYQFSQIRLSDTAHEFGSIPVGSWGEWDMIVFNDGNGDLIVQSIALSDQAYSTDVASFTVAPGQSRAVRVAFTPSAAGDFPCQLVINSNDPDGAASVSLSGLGTASARLRLSDDSHNFGAVAAGSSSAWSFSVSNEGNGDLVVSSVSSDNQAYATNLTQFVVAPGASQAVEVTFTPQQPGNYPGRLTIESNDAANPAVVTLQGAVNGTWHVPDDFQTIQSAIDAAVDGDTVLVADGRYQENINFTGKNIAVIGNSDHPENVVIDGGGNGSVVRLVGNEATGTLLSGFTLTNGVGSMTAIPNWGDASAGGGIQLIGASVRLENLVVHGNRAYLGGGVFISGGMQDIVNCRVERNYYSVGGGFAVWNDAEAQINRCVVTGNSATPDYNGWSGGAIDAQFGGRADVANSVIYGNQSQRGDIYLSDNSEVRFINSILWHTLNGAMFFGRLPSISYCDVQGGFDGVGNIDADPHFADPDHGDFRLGSLSPCIDAGDPNSPTDPDGTVVEMGAYYAPHYTIQLHEGWQIISSPTPPQNPDIRVLWSPLVGKGSLILTKNIVGQFYSPGQRFSNMPPWDVHQGYLVKMAAGVFDSLRFVNEPVDLGEPIPLRQGWNMVAYYPEANLTAPQAFANVAQVLDLAKDALGRFYRPSIGFSNMGTLSRGKGYMVRVRQVTELVWNAQGRMMMGDDDENANANVDVDGIGEVPSTESTPGHFVQPGVTGRNMSLVMNLEFGMRNLESGEIAAFTGSGLCVGASSFQNPNSKFQIGLAVWGDDPTTDAIDGAVEREALNFKLWDGTVETTVLPTGVPQGLCTLRDVASGYRDPEAVSRGDKGGVCYTTDGFAMVTLDAGAQGVAPVPSEYSLAEAYPNPFNGSTRISFGVPQDAAVTVGIYDLTGRLVTELASERVSAGSYSVVWNAEGIASGIYIVRMEAANFKASQKVVLVR